MKDLRLTVGPLDNLIAFEAAARCGNFSKAAHELNVSQPAVSRRIGHLESALGIELFERHGTIVNLTAAGVQLYAGVGSAFKTIEQTVNSIPQSTTDKTVSLRVNVAAAALWLIPHLSDFYGMFPETRVHLVCIDETSYLEGRDFDLEVRFGKGNWPDAPSRSLLDERVFPVASPRFKEQHRLESLDDIARVPLLQLAEFTSPLMDWNSWIPALGDYQAPIRYFTTYAMVLEAAACGHGVALGWEYYLRRPLIRGELLRLPVPKRTSAFGEYLVINPNSERRQSVRDTADWIVELARRTREDFNFVAGEWALPPGRMPALPSVT